MASAVVQPCCNSLRLDCPQVRLENFRHGGEARVVLRRQRRALPHRRRVVVGARSSLVSSDSVAVKGFEAGKADGVSWAGDDLPSRFINFLISIKPLFSVMKFGARRLMVRTAEKKGIPWQKMVEELRSSDVYAEKDTLENVEISYPDYYLQQFHGYDTGNLSWEAAFDVEPATMALVRRAVPSSTSVAEAEEIIRGRWLQQTESHHRRFSSASDALAILDLGCSTGRSTRSLQDHFPGAEITGIDLSPYFLAVAQHIQKKSTAKNASSRGQIRYLHANVEDTGLPSESFDIVSGAFLFHEFPQQATLNGLREARRLLRPGGTITLIDASRKSKVIQSLPPPLFVLMKSTEPWLDEYFMMDVDEELERIGFGNVTSLFTSPRHLTVTATAI